MVPLETAWEKEIMINQMEKTRRTQKATARMETEQGAGGGWRRRRSPAGTASAPPPGLGLSLPPQ